MYEKEGDKRVSVHYDKLMKVLSGLVTFYDNLATASILYGDITLPIYEIQTLSTIRFDLLFIQRIIDRTHQLE